MAGMTCAACRRTFGGLTGFDKHQTWIYEQGAGVGTCQDPATMTRKDGSPLFKQNDQGRWVLLVGKDHPHA